MERNQFAFRRFKKEDAELLYNEYADFCWNDIQPYYSGVGVVMAKADFLNKIEEYADKQYRPPIIVNNHDVPIGFYRIK